MEEIHNLDVLTEKIYKEGIEKAQEDSENIISKAETDRDKILENANSEAMKIIDAAKQQALKITRSSEKELQLKGKQLISDLKAEIHGLLSNKILNKSVKGAFADVQFLQSAMLEVIKSWNPTDELEIVLPEELVKKLDKAFSRSISEHSKNLLVTFNNRLTEGFQIIKKSEGYQIYFREEEFIELFTPYLSNQINELLFNTSK